MGWGCQDTDVPMRGGKGPQGEPNKWTLGDMHGVWRCRSVAHRQLTSLFPPVVKPSGVHLKLVLRFQDFGKAMFKPMR